MRGNRPLAVVGFWFLVLVLVWWVLFGFGVACVLFPSSCCVSFPFNDDLGTPPTRRPHSWKKKDLRSMASPAAVPKPRRQLTQLFSLSRKCHATISGKLLGKFEFDLSLLSLLSAPCTAYLALQHRALSDGSSFEVRNFGCKAENVIARHRMKNATDSEKRCSNQIASSTRKRK